MVDVDRSYNMNLSTNQAIMKLGQDYETLEKFSDDAVYHNQ